MRFHVAVSLRNIASVLLKIIASQQAMKMKPRPTLFRNNLSLSLLISIESSVEEMDYYVSMTS